MPKFTEQEKGKISKSLLSHGETLFCQHGLKKVTVSEITKAANIAKGSFYAFYSSKEELYFDILTRCQQRMWQQMDIFLKENTTIMPRDLVKSAMMYIFDLIGAYPLVKRTDSETMAVLIRKLPRSITEEHTGEDTAAIQIFTQYGVKFTKHPSVVAKSFQILYSAIMMLEEEDRTLTQDVIEVMIGGLVNELVEASK